MVGYLPAALLIPLLSGGINITAVLETTLETRGLSSPQSLACSPQGSLWVADRRGTRIHLFSPRGEHIRSFGGEGQGPCEFTDRIQLADPGGLYLYAADVDGARIIKMTRSGLCVREIRPVDDDDLQQISRPTAIASRRGGLLYVADAGFGTLMTLDLFDQLAPLTGRTGGGTPILVDPVGLACAEERVFLSDRAQAEVFVLDRFGNSLGRISFPGVPGGLDGRADGLLAIIDDSSDDVVFFHGLRVAGRLSETLPHLSLSRPADICFGPGSSLYLADAGHDRVVHLRIELSVRGVGDGGE